MSKIRAVGRRIQILKSRVVLSAAAMFYTVCLHSGSVFPVEIRCEILMRTEGTGAVAVRQHHFNNEQILDQANNFVG